MRNHLICDPVGEPVHCPFKSVVLNRHDRPAVAAHRMVVMLPIRVRRLVPGNGPAQIDLVHQMQVGEGVERAIHACHAGSGTGRCDLGAAYPPGTQTAVLLHQ